MVKFLAIGAAELKTLQEDFRNNHNVEVTVTERTNTEILIKNNNINIVCDDMDIKDYDYLWLKSAWSTRAFNYALSIYATSENIPHTKVEPEQSKLVDLLTLSIKNISIPTTYYTFTCNLLNKISKIETIFKYPFILKTTRGSAGSGVFLIENRENLISTVQNLNGNDNYTCQEFITNDFDYRVIVTNGSDVVSAEKRIRINDTFRNNACLGAEEVFLDINCIPEEVKNLAIKAAKATKLRWAGIDIVTSKKTGRNYILEVNRRPGLTEGSTEVTAAYNHILDLLKDHNLIDLE